MASVWGELKRRNVVKVAVAYAIVGWVLIEVSSVLLPTFQAPEWVMRVFSFFIIAGFPVALILSWAYEITPDGMRLSHEVPAPKSITHVTGRKLDFAIIGALVLALGFVVYNYVLEDEALTPVERSDLFEIQQEIADAIAEAAPDVLPNSVAVLPFRNDSPDPNNAYYASGIHEEILNHLVKLSALSVIARTSVEQYKDTEKPIPEIARELNVETVMEGSVRFDAGRIRITTQLNDGITGAHLWSETYTRDFDDIFAIESDVAMNVANALEAEFSLAEQENIEKTPTESPVAYALYLRALTGFWAGQDSWREDIDRALAVDPNFALAHARKAYMHARYAPLQSEQTILESSAIALRMDPTLGLAHVALAYLHHGNWRLSEAKQSFERALALSPNNSEILISSCRFYRNIGEYDKSVQLGRRATALDPGQTGYHYQLGIALRYARQYEEAIAAFQIALQSDPSWAPGYMQIAAAEIALGNREAATEALRIAGQLFGDVSTQPFRLPQLAVAHSQLDHREDVLRLTSQLEELDLVGAVDDALWTMAHIALGEYDEALERLELAVNERIPNVSTLAEIKANAYRIPALEEPRFQQLRDRIGALD